VLTHGNAFACLAVPGKPSGKKETAPRAEKIQAALTTVKQTAPAKESKSSGDQAPVHAHKIPTPEMAPQLRHTTTAPAKSNARKDTGSKGDDENAYLAQLAEATKRVDQSGGKAGKAPLGIDDVAAAEIATSIAWEAGSAKLPGIVDAISRTERRRVEPIRLKDLELLQRCCADRAAPPALRALCHVAISDVCLEMQDVGQALQHAKQAASLAPSNGSRDIAARAALRVAKAHEAVGDAALAMAAVREAVAHATGPEGEAAPLQPRFFTHCLMCFGSAADLTGRADIAAVCFSHALRLAEDLADSRLAAEVHVCNASSLVAHGHFDAAIELLRELVSPQRPLRDPNLLVRALTNAAQAMLITGDDTWESLLLLHVERAERAGDLNTAGMLYQYLGQYSRCLLLPAKALAYHEKELRAHDQPGSQFRTCDALNNLGLAHLALGAVAKASAAHTQEHRQAEEGHELMGEAKALTSLGHVHLLNNDAALARVCGFKAARKLDSVSQEDRERYATRIYCYEAEWKLLDLLEEAHLQSNDVASAFRVADRKHTAELHALLDPAPLTDYAKRVDPVAFCRAIDADFVFMYSFAWNDALEHINLYALDTASASFVHCRQPLPLRTLALLCSARSPFRRAAFSQNDSILLPHRVNRVLEAAANDELRDFLELDMESIENGCPAPWLEAFADELLRPLQSVLSTARQPTPRVAFVVDGMLAAVPFHALPLNGQPLIATCQVTHVPCLAVLRRVDQCAEGVGCGTARSDAATCPPLQTFANPASLSDVLAALHGDAAVCVLQWTYTTESREPFVGSIAIEPAGQGSAANALEAILAGCQPLHTVSFAEVLAAAAPPKAASTIVIDSAVCCATRMGHDVSIPIHAVFFALGHRLVIRATLTDSRYWSHAVLQPFACSLWRGASPSPSSFRDLCLSASNRSWHFAVISGAFS
jgi:tetratricopeptide (TPR) repeat protein